MLMVFIRNGNALLPELEVYRKHFEQKGFRVEITQGTPSGRLEPAIEWHFMGSGGQRIYPRSILVHEYASASVPPFRFLKDRIKLHLNAKPNLRIFLNEYVKSKLPFKDNTPYCYRDMGIPAQLINNHPVNNKKVYDFISVGSMEPYSHFRKLLEKFTSDDLSSSSLLVLTNEYQRIAAEWKAHSNIIFKGPVPHEDVIKYLEQSRYAINFRPSFEPFSRQTSTRTLEYIACKVPVLSIYSSWLEQFRQDHGGNYYILRNDLSNLDRGSLESFDFSFPSLENFTWEKVLEKSGIDQVLEKLIREKK